jgi:hypothetical protein
VAEPARQAPVQEDEPPILDPRVVERAYRRQRLKRRARAERSRERSHAHVRFWLVIIILVSLGVYLALTVWQELQGLFGV